ncbi:glycerol-3-phosphate 2-O-acyltransferase 6 [Selaginella moellendorffii]|nr:glycerol-3-phosphate 2-O-acyltransferase 6 [Selaginella moellendorffii]|eukprot:XP_002977695.2 glycerol-3-phosphate 2-O-acyltransferase 6 [Selaginella moellendorffii]
MSPAQATANGSARIVAAAAMAPTRKTMGLCVLEGALLRSSCGFPYLFLVAFEAGSIIRAFALLLAYPFLLVAAKIFESCLLDQALVFIALGGLKVSAVESVARAVLPKFYLEDLRWDCYSKLVNCKRRCVVATRSPRQLIEPFLREFLGAEQILGPELQITDGGYCTGLIIASSIPAPAVQADIGICCSSDRDLVRQCKEEFVVEASAHARPVPRKHYLKPLIFHDGRLAVRPTPAMALTIFLWLPIGIALAIPRSLILVLCPNIPLILAAEALLGIVLRYSGTPPENIPSSRPSRISSATGNLFVCSHRTLLDPVMLSGMVLRRVTAVTYSISWVSELLSPIRTVRLTRCRSHDARTISNHLRRGDLIVCPEGTTCREPYLLRFSKLFVEIAENVVPVAMNCEIQLFHGTSVRGWKAMDPFFFALNPRPRYEVNFLERLSLQELTDRGASSFEIANMIQHRIARALGFQCTGFTRRDKYRMLAEQKVRGGGGARKSAGKFENLKPAEDSKEHFLL